LCYYPVTTSSAGTFHVRVSGSGPICAQVTTSSGGSFIGRTCGTGGTLDVTGTAGAGNYIVYISSSAPSVSYTAWISHF